MAPKLTAQDKKWRAQDDAYALAQAAEVTADKSRLGMAKKAANDMLKEQQKRVQGLQKVVKTKPAAKPKASPKKATAKKGKKK